VTTFLLVRHAAHQQLDHVLVGRMAGVTLAEEGREQARRLARFLLADRITAVQSSPRERAQETAAPIASQAALPVNIASALDELDVGDWTGPSFAVLNDDAGWIAWNTARGTARPPNGESMAELQRRILAHLQVLHEASPGGRIVLVSHAEVIRAAVLHALRMPLDDFARIEIAPASISTLAVDRCGCELVALNRAVPS
jgi:broad specificity phosphatase PhoE